MLGGVRGGVLGWGAYLAASWTWCIGMYLPALLMRDHGWAGFVVFALPNVIGAAAMGWLMPAGDALEGWRRRHAVAIAWFSRVTVGFHLYFIGMLLAGVLPLGALPAGVAMVMAFMVVLRLAPGWAGVVSAGVLGVSLAAVGWLIFDGSGLGDVGLGDGGLDRLALDRAGQNHAGLMAGLRAGSDGLGAVGLVGVCGLGFGLCPYLDATFLHARAGAGRGGPAAFTLGFGVLFASMIGLTAWYAPLLGPTLEGAPGVLSGWARAALALHLTLQSAFTVAVHVDRGLAARSGSKEDRAAREAGPGGVGLGLASGMLLGMGFVSRFLPDLPLSGMAAPEVGYRLFMTCYGLIFPAYVWLVAWPGRRRAGSAGVGPAGVGWDGRPAEGARIARMWWVCAAAAPCYAVGFLGGSAWWLIPGAGVVLAGRWVMPRGSGASAPSLSSEA